MSTENSTAADRVAIVSGAASGIGRAIAGELAGRNHPVALLDRSGDAVRAAADELANDGARVIGLEVDVSDRASVDAAVEKARAELGPISIIVTSAGIQESAPFGEITAESWQRTLDVNLTGTFNTIQSALPDLLEAGWAAS